MGVFVLMMVLVAACTDFRPRVGSPWMQKLLTQGPKDSPTLFQEGWVDGCETGISASSNAFQRHFYAFKQNPDHARNQVYYAGWKTAFLYCARYVAQYLRRPYL
jgi:hypothetical protein